MVEYIFYSAVLKNDLALAFRILSRSREDMTLEEMIEKLSAELNDI